MNNYKLLERVFNSCFVYEGLPDTVDIDFINFYLNNLGYVTWCKADDGTIRTLQGAISGIDVYNRPTDFESANPISKYSGIKRKIGKDCVVMYNTLNNRKPESNIRLFRKYEKRLNEIDRSIMCAIYNTRVSSIFSVESDPEAQQVRAMCDDVAEGRPFIITNTNAVRDSLLNVRKSLVESLPVKANYVLDLLLRDRYTILCNYLTEIGINNTPFEKKERQIETEVDSNNELLNITAFEFLQARKKALTAVNDMFGLNISVEFNREIERSVESVLSDV